MIVFLIGFMGCGKSTSGRKLASSYGYPFIDLDKEIERKVGCTIAAYFEDNGELAFRKMEQSILKEFEYPENCIVATGGGTPCYEDNMAWMNQKGLTVYLQLTPAALAKRLESGQEKRPLIRGLDEASLIAFIETKLAERAEYYDRAGLTVDGLNFDIPLVKDLINSTRLQR